MKYFAIFMLLLFGFGRAAAQDDSTIVRGEISGKEGQRPDYYNILIKQQQDSAVVSGSCFYTDKFELRIPRTDQEVLLCITSLGYKDRYILLRRGAAEEDLGKIALEEEVLDQVVVRPRAITNAGSRATVQVEGTTLQNLSSVTDILQRAPMVTASDEGVTVFGKGTPLIYIDGKISSYDAVKELQPTQIISMLIDRNPSARYEATYRSVLKITTTRKREGISGQLYNQSMFYRRYGNNAGGHLQVNKGRWSNYLGASYRYSDNLSYSDGTDVIDYAGYKLLDSTFHTNYWGHHRYNITYGSSFKINDKQSLSWQYDFTNLEDNGRNKSLVEERIYENGEASRLHSETRSFFAAPNHKANLMYTYQIGEKKRLEVTADYGHMRNDERQEVIQRPLPDGEVSTLQTDSKSRSDVFSGMAEYAFPLLNADFLVGGRYNRVASDVGSSYDGEYTGTVFRNNVIAAYATADKAYDKWGFSLGLRGEFSKDDVQANGERIRNQWNNHLFPSASVYTDGLFKTTDLMFSYRSSISHPSVSELNPASSYVNSVIISRGNALLYSLVNHCAEFSATFWKALTLTASYDYFQNERIETGVLSDDGKHIFFQPVNIPRSHEYSLMAAFTKQWDKFGLSVDGSVRFPYAKIPYMDAYWINDKTSYSGSVSFDIRLSPTTLLSCAFAAESRSCDLMSVWEPTYGLDCSLSQQLFKKRMTVIVSATDLLHRSVTDWSDYYGYYEGTSRSSHDTRGVRLMLRYNFNRDKNKFRGRTNSDIYDRVN